MPHFVSILTDTSNAAAPARSAALVAITALCASWPVARDDFFSCGGASTVLHTLLQPERGPSEARASVQLLATVAAASEECREIMSENGVMGIEVLVQVCTLHVVVQGVCHWHIFLYQTESCDKLDTFTNSHGVAHRIDSTVSLNGPSREWQSQPFSACVPCKL